jgi:hypothetical protein
MIWSDSYYYRHEQAETYIKQILGLTQLDYWKERQVLIPYYYYIIQYLNTKLTDLGTTDIKELVEEVLKIFEWGGDLIIAHKSTLLAEKLGYYNDIYGNYVPDIERPSQEVDNDDEILPDVEYIDLDTGQSAIEMEFDMEYFLFCWGDFMSTLVLRLKLQYGYLFNQEEDGECCVCGARGQTETDYESWESGIYPEDECYDRSNYYRSNTAWGLQKDRYCECYKHE